MRSSYFRVSVTSRCNFNCYYCHNEGQSGDEVSPLSADDIVWVVGIAARLGFSKIKLTGGEPTLRPDLPRIVSGIRALGIDDLSMITNGSALPCSIQKLREAGLPRINISLYTLDSEKFEISQGVRRGLLERSILGVDAALAAGYRDMKLNYVMESKDFLSDLLSVLAFANARNLTVVVLPLIASLGAKQIISLHELNELIRSLGVIREEISADEAGIQRSLLTLESGSRVLLRLNELGNIGPFAACEKCAYSSECLEGIFPMRLSDSGVLSPCLANPTLRRNIRESICSRDGVGVARMIQEMAVDP